MNQTFTNLIIWLAVIDSLFLVSNIRYMFKKDAQKSLVSTTFAPSRPVSVSTIYGLRLLNIIGNEDHLNELVVDENSNFAVERVPDIR